MRPRKITAVLAVSVALVLVAREIEVRRRAQRGSSSDLAGDLSSEPLRPSGAEARDPSTDPAPVVEATVAVPTAQETGAPVDGAPSAEESRKAAGRLEVERRRQRNAVAFDRIDMGMP